jgi:hypothetical protein
VHVIPHGRRSLPALLTPEPLKEPPAEGVRVKRMFAIWLALIVAVLFNAQAATAQATTFTSNEREPLEVFVFVPCANGNAGEFVLLSGTLHVLSHVTIDGQDGFHVTQHFQPQGVSGLGLVSGDKYQGTGVTRNHLNAKAGEVSTFVNNFRIIGQGRGNNLLVHAVFHVTVTPNGDIATVIDNFSVECR